jgi:hypothetical protein
MERTSACGARSWDLFGHSENPSLPHGQDGFGIGRFDLQAVATLHQQVRLSEGGVPRLVDHRRWRH